MEYGAGWSGAGDERVLRILRYEVERGGTRTIVRIEGMLNIAMKINIIG